MIDAIDPTLRLYRNAAMLLRISGSAVCECRWPYMSGTVPFSLLHVHTIRACQLVDSIGFHSSGRGPVDNQVRVDACTIEVTFLHIGVDARA